MWPTCSTTVHAVVEDICRSSEPELAGSLPAELLSSVAVADTSTITSTQLSRWLRREAVLNEIFQGAWAHRLYGWYKHRHFFIIIWKMNTSDMKSYYPRPLIGSHNFLKVPVKNDLEIDLTQMLGRASHDAR